MEENRELKTKRKYWFSFILALMVVQQALFLITIFGYYDVVVFPGFQPVTEELLLWYWERPPVVPYEEGLVNFVTVFASGTMILHLLCIHYVDRGMGCSRKAGWNRLGSGIVASIVAVAVFLHLRYCQPVTRLFMLMLPGEIVSIFLIWILLGIKKKAEKE